MPIYLYKGTEISPKSCGGLRKVPVNSMTSGSCEVIPELKFLVAVQNIHILQTQIYFWYSQCMMHSIWLLSATSFCILLESGARDIHSWVISCHQYRRRKQTIISSINMPETTSISGLQRNLDSERRRRPAAGSKSVLP